MTSEWRQRKILTIFKKTYTRYFTTSCKRTYYINGCWKTFYHRLIVNTFTEQKEQIVYFLLDGWVAKIDLLWKTKFDKKSMATENEENHCLCYNWHFFQKKNSKIKTKNCFNFIFIFRGKNIKITQRFKHGLGLGCS